MLEHKVTDKCFNAKSMFILSRSQLFQEEKENFDKKFDIYYSFELALIIYSIYRCIRFKLAIVQKPFLKRFIISTSTKSQRLTTKAINKNKKNRLLKHVHKKRPSI